MVTEGSFASAEAARSRPDEAPGERAGLNRYDAAAMGLGGAVVLALAYWLLQTEFPLVDGVRTFEHVRGRSWTEMWADLFAGTEEFRPLYFMLVKLVHDLAGGPSLVAFRFVQIGLIALDLALYAALLQPERPAGLFGFTLAAGAFVGLHTSMDNLTTAAPLPYGPLVIGLILGTLLLLRRPPGLGVDLLAGAFATLAVFLIEYGVAVGLIWIAAGLMRFGAARRRTALFASLGLLGYMALRLSTNVAAIPGPFYTETGFLFRENLQVAEQRALFGGYPWLFHLYNVSATLLTVLLSEPRAGVYYGLDALWNAKPVEPWQVVNWLTSIGATGLLVFWIGRWRDRSRSERMLLGFGAGVIAINCAMGYMYTRDRIPVVAGAYYALLVGMAGAALWQTRARVAPGGRRLLLTAGLLLLAAGWGLRAAGTIVWARDQAWSVRDEWTDRFSSLRSPDAPRSEIVAEFRRRSLTRSLPNPREDPEWMWELFERKNF